MLCVWVGNIERRIVDILYEYTPKKSDATDRYDICSLINSRTLHEMMRVNRLVKKYWTFFFLWGMTTFCVNTPWQQFNAYIPALCVVLSCIILYITYTIIIIINIVRWTDSTYLRVFTCLTDTCSIDRPTICWSSIRITMNKYIFYLYFIILSLR